MTILKRPACDLKVVSRLQKSLLIQHLLIFLSQVSDSVCLFVVILVPLHLNSRHHLSLKCTKCQIRFA